MATCPQEPEQFNQSYSPRRMPPRCWRMLLPGSGRNELLAPCYLGVDDESAKHVRRSQVGVAAVLGVALSNSGAPWPGG